jgi:hypothetical protein
MDIKKAVARYNSLYSLNPWDFMYHKGARELICKI